MCVVRAAAGESPRLQWPHAEKATVGRSPACMARATSKPITQQPQVLPTKKCPLMGQDDGYAPLVATMPWISRTMLLLLGCWIQEMGRLPHKTPPRHLQRISSDHSCRYIGLGQHMSPIHPQTMGPRVASLKAFPFFISNFLHLSYFTTSWMLPQGCEDPLIPITDRSGCVKITATPTPLIM